MFVSCNIRSVLFYDASQVRGCVHVLVDIGASSRGPYVSGLEGEVVWLALCTVCSGIGRGWCRQRGRSSLVAMASMDRENALWRLVGSFGWTVQVAQRQWDFPEASASAKQRVFAHKKRHLPRTKKTLFTTAPVLKKRARVRPTPSPFERKKGRGTSIRWLPTVGESAQDPKFGPTPSTFYQCDPKVPIIGRMPRNNVLLPRPRSSQSTGPTRYKNKIKVFTDTKMRSTSSFMLFPEDRTQTSVADSYPEHTRRQYEHEEFCRYDPEEVQGEMRSPTSKMHHRKQQKRLVRVFPNEPTLLGEFTALKLHAILKKHAFTEKRKTAETARIVAEKSATRNAEEARQKTAEGMAPPMEDSAPEKGTDDRTTAVEGGSTVLEEVRPDAAEGGRSTTGPIAGGNSSMGSSSWSKLNESMGSLWLQNSVEDAAELELKGLPDVWWEGRLETLWAMGEELQATLPTAVLLSCDDFYVLGRSSGWCKSYLGKPMSRENQGKIIRILVSEALTSDPVAILSRPSTAPPTARPRERRQKIDYFAHMDDQRIRLPYKWPGMMGESQHRNAPHIGFAMSTREQYQKIQHPSSTSNTVGPGSFHVPTSMQRQIESAKRNAVTTTSLSTKVRRKTPLENCRLGYIESPGPQVFAPSPTLYGVREDIGIPFGPGYIDPFAPSIKPYKASTKALSAAERRKKELERLQRDIVRMNKQCALMKQGYKKLKGTKELTDFASTLSRVA